MPEPGASDRNFDHPTTDRNPGTDRERSDAASRDPSDRNRYRRRSQGRMKLPAEYADFKLADGRTLRDVMGDKFFGSVGKFGGGKWMSKGVRERLREGGSPFRGGMFENMDPKKLAELLAKRTEARARRAAEQQARRDERRVRVEARRAAHRGGYFSFGGEL